MSTFLSGHLKVMGTPAFLASSSLAASLSFALSAAPPDSDAPALASGLVSSFLASGAAAGLAPNEKPPAAGAAVEDEDPNEKDGAELDDAALDAAGTPNEKLDPPAGAPNENVGPDEAAGFAASALAPGFFTSHDAHLTVAVASFIVMHSAHLHCPGFGLNRSPQPPAAGAGAAAEGAGAGAAAAEPKMPDVEALPDLKGEITFGSSSSLSISSSSSIPPSPNV
jgi:hypothetical protein